MADSKQRIIEQYYDEMNVRLAWIHDDGSLSPPWPASDQHFDGIIPAIGDTVVVRIGREYDAGIVCERYHIEDGEESWWQLVMKPVRPTTDRIKLFRAGRTDTRSRPD